jgi:oxalate decarboxylase
MSDQFWFDLAAAPPTVTAKGGTIQEANATTFPALDGLAIYLLTLEPGGLRIPHWHPDAAEMDYCLSGTATIGLADPDRQWQKFTLTAGQIAYLPQGWFHYIQNTGQDAMRMLVIFNNQSPNDIGISQAFQVTSPEVLGLAFNVPPSTFQDLDENIDMIAPQ